MFRWNLMLRTRFASRHQQPKDRRSRTTVRPSLEALEDRTLPSASSLPAVFEASPPAAASVAAITSYMFSMMEARAQLIATVEQDVSNTLNALGQDFVQELAFIQRQLDSVVSIDPNSSNPSQGAAVAQHSGSAIMGHKAPKPSTTDAKPASATAGGG